MKPTDFKKTLGRIALCGVFAISAMAATACSNETCQHDYKWYLATEPTCTKNGLMEGLCESCGEKTYQDVEAKGHTYQDDICTVCGQAKNKEYLHNENVGWTLRKMYERYTSLGFDDVTYEEFQAYVIGENAELSVSALGNLHVLLNGEYSTTLVNVREDFSVTGGESGQIRSVCLESGNFCVTLTDGTTTKYGLVKDLFNFEVSHPITRIALNKKNELAVIYDDNEIVKVGVVPTQTEEINESTLLYYKDKSSSFYTIQGTMDINVQNLVIPTSHRGVAVTSIDSYSFSNCSKLKTVVIPQTVTHVDAYCFPKGVTLFVEGYTECPAGWSASWNRVDENTTLTVYWANEWTMVNGVPTPNNS